MRIGFVLQDPRRSLSGLDTYTWNLWEALRSLGGEHQLVPVTLRPLFWFLRRYLVQRTFLDGWAGLVHSICTFIHIFFRHAKLRELHTVEEGSTKQ